MFQMMDSDKSGKLSYSEFRDSFRTLSYGLNDNDISMLIALADEDENEQIDWKQFIPIGIEAIRTFYTRNIAKQDLDKKAKIPDHNSLRMVYKQEIDKCNKLLSYQFLEYDPGKENKEGVLVKEGIVSLQDFKKIIRGTKFLTPKEKNLLIRLQKNEMIKYSEFPDMLYNVRFEIAMSEMMEYNI